VHLLPSLPSSGASFCGKTSSLRWDGGAAALALPASGPFPPGNGGDFRRRMAVRTSTLQPGDAQSIGKDYSVGRRPREHGKISFGWGEH
jgi:hypothetical protein